MLRLKSLLGLGFGVNPVFFADGDAGDGSGGDGSGGSSSGDSKTGDSGDADKGKGDASNKPETYQVKIDGEDRSLSLDEIKELASKSGGADKRFNEAAEASKAAERGIRVETLVKVISGTEKPSDADIRELAGLLEINPQDFMNQLHQDADPAPKGTKKDTDMDFNAKFQEAMGATPAEVRAILEFSQTRHVGSARQEIREISDKAVDKDEIFGKMVIGKDKDDIKLTIKDMVAEDVLKKIQDGVPFGAKVVTEAVQRVRATLIKLGIPNNLTQHPIVLGLGPSDGLSPEIQADEPIKRIPSTDDGDEANLIARTLQKGLQAYRAQQR